MSKASMTLLAAALLVGSGLAPADDEPAPISGEQLRQFMFFAVLEGLYKDGVSTEDVDIVLRRDDKDRYVHFIYACPLCMPTLNAILVYRDRRHFYGWKGVTDTFGAGLSREQRAGLRSEVASERFEVIDALVKGWVERRLESMNPGDAQRSAWRGAILAGRKEGMSVLEAQRLAGTGGLFQELGRCAVCDGAFGGTSTGEGR